MKSNNIEDINHLETESMVTVGMFDGLHIGHRQLIAHLLDEASRLKLRPVVVTFNRHPREVTGNNPPTLLTTYKERIEKIASCGVEHIVTVDFTPDVAALSACQFAREYLCQRLSMKRLLLGYDNQFGNRQHNDFDHLPELARELHFEIHYDEPVYWNGIDVSSTKIRRALEAGDIESANAMLGAPYQLCGTVTHGRHEGTALGFPTANIEPEKDKVIPGNGVYALRVHHPNGSALAMANLGPQPTFGIDRQVLEVHLLDFNGDLYGESLQLQFLARLRDIRPFESHEALATQLKTDREILLERYAKSSEPCN